MIEDGNPAIVNPFFMKQKKGRFTRFRINRRGDTRFEASSRILIACLKIKWFACCSEC